MTASGSLHVGPLVAVSRPFVFLDTGHTNHPPCNVSESGKEHSGAAKNCCMKKCEAEDG